MKAVITVHGGGTGGEGRQQDKADFSRQEMPERRRVGRREGGWEGEKEGGKGGSDGDCEIQGGRTADRWVAPPLSNPIPPLSARRT